MEDKETELLSEIADLKSKLDEQNEAIAELIGLKEAIKEKDDMIWGLQATIAENETTVVEMDQVIEGLVRSKMEDIEMIKGLENSLAETEKYLEVTIEKWKQTVNEIYNSSTWKLVSKFTKAQTKIE